tara:strand:+ start:424 stop:2169 length:1746 start_codon:yes stop_codon:yes gene_type:complete
LIKTEVNFKYAVLVVAVAGLTYLNSLDNGFTLDDYGLVLQNKAVTTCDVVEFFVSDYWSGFEDRRSGLYRPLTLLTFAIEYKFFGSTAFGYHLTNLILHVVVSLLVVIVFRGLVDAPTAILAGLFFAVHPIHTEAVSAIAGRADLLATLFVLSSVGVSRHGYDKSAKFWQPTALFFALALLSKESAVVLPALLFCRDWNRRRVGWPWPWYEYAGMSAVLLVYIAIRVSVVDGLAIRSIDPLDNPLVELESAARIFNAVLITSKYIGLIILPYKLSADYSYNSIPLVDISPIIGWAIIASLGIAIVWMVRVYVSTPRVWMFTVLWMGISFSVVSNAVVPIGTIMAERLVYLPSVGFALLVGSALRHNVLGCDHQPIRKCWLLTLVITLIVSGLLLSARRNEVWKDNFTLFSATIASYPENAKARNGLGTEFKKRGKKLQAEKEFRRAIEIRPDMRTAHYMLGKLQYESGDFRQALESYQMALNIDAGYPEAILNLGATYQRLGDNSAAVQAYKRALDLRPGWLIALENLANAIYATGEFEHAAALYEKLLRLQPAHLRRDLFERRIIEFRSMLGRAVQALDD